MNSEVEGLKVEKEKLCSEIERLKEKIRCMEVYQRRENLRFHGIPEAAEEDTGEMSYKFFENNLKIERARDIEFQRIQRVGKKKAGQNRPIIARFLLFHDRQLVYRRAMVEKNTLEASVSEDLPKEFEKQERSCGPNLDKREWLGKLLFSVVQSQINYLLKEFMFHWKLKRALVGRLAHTKYRRIVS